MTKVDEITQRALAGEPGGIARALSIIERGLGGRQEVLAQAFPRAGRAAITGFTGPPGVGKSTLLAALTADRRAAGERVAVLSVDPSSSFTRGALLGDRLRLVDHFEDDGVFIRSMASRGALGGLADAAVPAVTLLDAAGFDHVFVETVGVGQTEIEVVDHVDSVVLVLMPGSGDSVQAIKAGVMEIPDVVAVNKADDPRARDFAREVRRLLRPRTDEWVVPVVEVTAIDGSGIEEVVTAIADHRSHLRARGALEAMRNRRAERMALQVAGDLFRRQVMSLLETPGPGAELRERLSERTVDPIDAARELLALSRSSRT